MKYSIYINQLVLEDTNLDLKECAILSFLKDFCKIEDRGIKKITITEEGESKSYTWINFNYLISEMPLLRLKGKSSISEKIKNIEKAGFIKTFIAPDRSLYVRLSPKIKELDFSEKQGSVRKSEQSGVRHSEQGVRYTEQHNQTINNQTINSVSKDTAESGYGNSEINELVSFLKENLGLSILDGSDKENRRYCWLAIKKFKRSGVEAMIKIAAENDFWANKITGFKTLYYNGVKIVSTIKDKTPMVWI